MMTDSFEKPGKVKWQQTWGPVAVTDERAQEGKQCIKETLEDKYGLSVYHVPLPPYPRTTYRASAWVYVPAQEKSAPPCLAFVRGDWSLLDADGNAVCHERAAVFMSSGAIHWSAGKPERAIMEGTAPTLELAAEAAERALGVMP